LNNRSPPPSKDYVLASTCRLSHRKPGPTHSHTLPPLSPFPAAKKAAPKKKVAPKKKAAPKKKVAPEKK
jgi:hypothetical protein